VFLFFVFFFVVVFVFGLEGGGRWRRCFGGEVFVCLLVGWLVVSWFLVDCLVGCSLVVSLVGCWLVVGWLLVDC